MISKSLAQNLHQMTSGRSCEPETQRPTVIPSDRLVFLGGLPLNASREEVQEYLEQFGPIDKLILPKDLSTKKIKGYGKALFIDKSGALRALAMSCHEIRGMKFGVSPWIDPTCYNQIKNEMAQRKVYVKHRPQHTKEALLAYFEQFGHVEAIDMRLSFSSNKSRNFCYVLFESEQVAHRVVSRRNHNLLGSPLVCQMCIPQTKSESTEGIEDSTCKEGTHQKHSKKVEAKPKCQKGQTAAKGQKTKTKKGNNATLNSKETYPYAEHSDLFQESQEALDFYGEDYHQQVYIHTLPSSEAINYPSYFQESNPAYNPYNTDMISQFDAQAWNPSQSNGCSQLMEQGLYLTKQGHLKSNEHQTALPSVQVTPESKPSTRPLQQVGLSEPAVSRQHFTSSQENQSGKSAAQISCQANQLSHEFKKSRDALSQTLPDVSFSQEEDFLDSLIKPTSTMYPASRTNIIEARHLVTSNLSFRAMNGQSRIVRV